MSARTVLPAAVLALALAGCGATSRAAAPQPTLDRVQQLVARGGDLYTADGCVGCHSLDGSRGVGPSFKSLAGSTVVLTDGRSRVATRAYLEQSIAAPDAQTVKGYPPHVMALATGRLRLARHSADVRALVEFIETIGPG